MVFIKIKLIFALSFVCQTLMAQSVPGEQTVVEQSVDVQLTDPYLSIKYQRGPYMIYDCFAGHWVCTGKPEFKNCRDIRAIRESDGDANLGCAVIKEFDNEKQCNLVQKRLTSRGYENRFCKSDTVRKMNRFFY